MATLVAAAQQAQASQHFAEAANEYREALKIRPDMAELWANLGLMEREAGNMPQALSSLEHANRLNPSLYVPNLFLGIDYAHAGKTKEAIAYLLKAEKENKTDPEPRMALGKIYTTLGDYSLAADTYSQIVNVDPKQSSAWFALGIARLNLVETYSRKLTAQDHDSAYEQALFAESLDKQSKFAKAVGIYKDAINTSSQPPCLHAELGWALLHDQKLPEASVAFDLNSTPECPLSALGQARVAILQAGNDRVIQILGKLWRTDPGFVTSNISILTEDIPSPQLAAFKNFLLNDAGSMQKDLFSAISFSMSGSSIQRVPDTVDPAVSSALTKAKMPAGGTAESYYASGQFRLCSDQLNLGSSSLRPKALLLQATCSYLTGNYSLAAHAGAALIRASTNPAPGLYWSIRANEKLAFQALARYEQLEPDAARSHVLLGDILRQRTEYTEAIAEYTKAHEIDPADKAAILGMASAYLANDDVDESVETAQSALLLGPDDPEINIVMAEGLIARRDYQQAEQYLTKGLNAKPQMLPHVHALLGEIYEEAGRAQEAIKELNLGITSDDDGSIHYRLARLYRQMGDQKDAAAALNEAKLIKAREHRRELFVPEDGESVQVDSKPQR